MGTQFKNSLQILFSNLENTSPHYVRCIKPNLNKLPCTFDAGEVLRQLRNTGMIETIRVRREGYAYQETHESFYHRFQMLKRLGDDTRLEGIRHLFESLSKS